MDQRRVPRERAWSTMSLISSKESSRFEAGSSFGIRNQQWRQSLLQRYVRSRRPSRGRRYSDNFFRMEEPLMIKPSRGRRSNIFSYVSYPDNYNRYPAFISTLTTKYRRSLEFGAGIADSSSPPHSTQVFVEDRMNRSEWTIIFPLNACNTPSVPLPDKIHSNINRLQVLIIGMVDA
jgi:hypothetical protein